MLDLVVQAGTILDGTGRQRFQADVGVRDGRIVAIGGLAATESARRLDAEGLLVAPGFIDIHSHSDFTLLIDPRAQSSISQGVTTEVVGNCGHGCAPLTDPALFIGNIYGYAPDVEIDWHSMSEYLARLDAAGPAVNVVPLVPNGNLRLAVLGMQDRPATEDEIGQMERLLEASLEEGAFGFSTGLEYPTERACSEEETIRLCRIVARSDGLYATHTRNKEVYAVEAVEEGIRVAESAGVRLQVSHIIPRRGGPPDAREKAIEAVDSASARGMDIAFDAHTRMHGITNVSTALPTWAFEGGTDKLAARLNDPAIRAKMRGHQSIISSFGLGGWDRVYLFKSEHRPDLVGKSFQELAPAGGDVYDAIFDLMLAEIDDPHAPLCICHSYDEDELRQTFRHPLCMVGSDATALATDGPLASTEFLGAFTWAAWFFRRCVYETAEITLEEAVHKLTAVPAERLGLTDRGRLVEGSWADIVVFDPARFRERGTLEDPNQLAEGVAHVVVNGGVTIEKGGFTGNRSGQVHRRK